MWHPWTIGALVAALVGGLGLGTWISSSRWTRRIHGFGLVFLVAWTLIGALTVVLTEDFTNFDLVMVLGLLGMVGMTGYLSPRPDDRGWARAVHGLLGVIVVVWFTVIAHRYGEW